MKKYINLHTTDLDYLMDYKDSIKLENFTENISNYVNHHSRLESEYTLEFFIEEKWCGDCINIQLSCKRLETDFEYEGRIKQDEINVKIIQKSKLIDELKKLSKEDLNEILGYVNETK